MRPHPFLPLLALALALPACSDARKGDLPESRIRGDAQLALGRRTFMRHCHECHVQGGPGLGPGIIDKPLPAAAIKTQVRVGASTMPAFPEAKISGDELDAVVAYLGVLKREGVPLAQR
ncbi:MAG TPA: cytochrome c [Humisphaera sp.]